MSASVSLTYSLLMIPLQPDENAPERPPSAYVLFSNSKSATTQSMEAFSFQVMVLTKKTEMREDLKSQNLTFTEIAKLVGENWQNLPPAEKEAFESQANAAKEKYHRDLVEYKKTPEYRRYVQYLQDFKQRQARQNQGPYSSRLAHSFPHLHCSKKASKLT